ncbi:hypothetical protein K3495_g484 [Podosphaera aphanis]|nr:hypothetical protein K3495_g484 [Podosphaera aphanis]
MAVPVLPVEIIEKKSLLKPEKPDEEAYKTALKNAEKDYADAVASLDKIKAQLDIAKPNSNDSPSAKHRTQLVSQLKEIREKQVARKDGRNKIFDQIKKEDSALKDMIAQQKTARSRLNFKSVEDVDKEIERLEKLVNSGTMKIVDERKVLDEIPALRRQRKTFIALEESQKAINTRKTLVQQLREKLDDPESKALSDQYNQIQLELDAIKSEQNTAYRNINSLRDERNKLQDEKQAKYLAIREIKDKYYEQNRAVQKWEYEARQRARDKKKADEEKYQQEKKKARAQQILTEASDKAYLDEIRRAHSLLHFLDPSYLAEKTPLQAPSKFQAVAQRQVDDTGIKGIKITKKEEEDYFAGTARKKGKKSKKSAAKDSSSTGKYSCPPSVMEDCAVMGIDPPMIAADIPIVKEKVLAKLDFWKADQDAETERNIAKARKELERLEAEESMNQSSPNSKTENVRYNGDVKASAIVPKLPNSLALDSSARIDAIVGGEAISSEGKL